MSALLPLVSEGLAAASDIVVSVGQQIAQAEAAKVSADIVADIEHNIEQGYSSFKRKVSSEVHDVEESIERFFKQKKAKFNNKRQNRTQMPTPVMQPIDVANLQAPDVQTFEPTHMEDEKQDRNSFIISNKFNSFLKMPAYGKRRRSKRSKKFVTKLGVKNLIANYIPSNRAKYHGYHAGFCYGGFNQRAFNVVPLLAGGTWTTGSTKAELNQMRDLAFQAVALESSEDFSWKNYRRQFMFHNPVTEGEIVTLWLLYDIPSAAIIVSVFCLTISHSPSLNSIASSSSDRFSYFSFVMSFFSSQYAFTTPTF